jgi:UDP-galactose transporter B1
MMCWMNFWCALFYGCYLGASGIGGQLLRFCAAHADAAWDVALFCLCGAVGQLFIFATIKRFGSLVNTLICTTRKFFNILGSVVLNANPLLPQQWWAVGLVFAGLLTSSVAKSGHSGGHGGAGKQQQQQQQQPQQPQQQQPQAAGGGGDGVSTRRRPAVAASTRA